MLKWLGKFVKYWLNFANFHSCHEKWMKVGQILSKTFTKVHSIYQKFSQSFTFSFNKISFCFISLMNKIFRFKWDLQLPIIQECPSIWLNGARLPPKYIFKNYTEWTDYYKKNCQIFQRIAKIVAKSKKAKISTAKLNLKTQNIYIKPF